MRWVHVEDLLGTAALASIFGVMLVAVFARYVLNDSLYWSEELARLGLVAITFLGLGTGFRRGTHVAIDPAVWAPARLGPILAAGAGLASVVFLAALAYYAYDLSITLRTARTAALQLPLYWLYLGVAIAAALGALRAGVALVRRLAGIAS